MRNLTRQQLEQAAIDAHKSGDDWATFWNRHAGDVAMIEVQDGPGYDKLVRLLLALVVASDCDGQQPVAAGWELDDEQAVPAVPIINDVTTAARCLWTPANGAGSAG